MPPEMADILLRGGWDLQDYLFGARRAYAFDGVGAHDRPLGRTPADIHPIVTGGAGIKMTHLPLWAGGTETVTKRPRDLGD